MKAIGQGDLAPDFQALDQEGKAVSLAEFRGVKWVVLFFYPKDGSPICTREACHFRDAYEQFVAAGAEVIGVSGDSTESHRWFAAAHKLPFRLLSDAEGTIRKSFGVAKTLGVFPGRVTYVIDKQGQVRLVFNSQIEAAKHVSEALGVIQG
jgi:peroxiredoxin Q/BCP